MKPHDHRIYRVNIDLRHQYGTSDAESQTFLLAGETAVFKGYYNTSPKVGIKVFKLTVSFLILTALPASLKRPYKIKNKLLINVNLFCYITVFSPAVTVAGYDEIRVGDAMMKWRECLKTKRYKKKGNFIL